MVELTVRNASMVGVSKEIIHSIYTKCITDDNLRKNRLPVREQEIVRFLRPHCKFDNIVMTERWCNPLPDGLHLIAADDCAGEPLVVPPTRQKLLFGGMREWQMPDIVAQCRHPKNTSPISSLILIVQRFEPSSDLIGRVVRDDVEYSACKFHDAKRMLEAFMRRTWVNEIGQCQLVNVAQSLKRTGVENFALVTVKPDKYVNRIPNLVNVLHHHQIPLS